MLSLLAYGLRITRSRLAPQAYRALGAQVYADRYPPSVSDLKLTCLQNPFSGYSLDWTPPNLSLVGLAVVCITYRPV